MAVQMILHIKLRPECFPELQDLLYARLCFARKEFFLMCYNTTNLCSCESVQNGCCHTTKKTITCDILGSPTCEHPDDIFSEI